MCADRWERDGACAETGYAEFYRLCQSIEARFEAEWKDTEESGKRQRLEREKRAMMGDAQETRYYKEKIAQMLFAQGEEGTAYPPWYSSLADGIFHEVYGLAGLAPWAYDEKPAYANSSSAKLIGDRLYCLIDGVSQLQPQRIAEKRREQLKRTLLLATPRERLEEGFHEVYLHNGIRITIFSGERTKAGQDVMVFRKYILKELTFEKLAELGTIPREAIPLFRVMIRIGFNVLFAGQVRSGKTTFMQVWQREEDPKLEGLAIATDPETPWHELMPDAPIMQLTADGAELDRIGKSLVRGDNDYVLLEEMRDATAYHLALEITSTGTMRSKATIHDRSAENIPYKMACAIREKYGGDQESIICQVFRNFNYVMEFYQVPGHQERKRLRCISSYAYDAERDRVSVHRLCHYDETAGVWRWKCDMETARQTAMAGYGKEVKQMEEILGELERRNPIMGNTVIYPRYYQPQRIGDGAPQQWSCTADRAAGQAGSAVKGSGQA